MQVSIRRRSILIGAGWWKDWYPGESNHDYNTGKSKGDVILYFTQVVGKETSELGMATATNAGTWFTVARCKPRGNMGHEYDYIAKCT